MNKEIRDRLNILQQAELIHKRAEEITKEHKTISKLRAFQMATDEIFGGSKWSY